MDSPENWNDIELKGKTRIETGFSLFLQCYLITQINFLYLFSCFLCSFQMNQKSNSLDQMQKHATKDPVSESADLTILVRQYKAYICQALVPDPQTKIQGTGAYKTR